MIYSDYYSLPSKSALLSSTNMKKTLSYKRPVPNKSSEHPGSLAILITLEGWMVWGSCGCPRCWPRKILSDGVCPGPEWKQLLGIEKESCLVSLRKRNDHFRALLNGSEIHTDAKADSRTCGSVCGTNILLERFPSSVRVKRAAVPLLPGARLLHQLAALQRPRCFQLLPNSSLLPDSSR